jgi:hypothetical protein
MDIVITFFTNLTSGEWVGVLVAFLVAFDRLAKLTPTLKDDGTVTLLYRIFAILGVKVPDRQ